MLRSIRAIAVLVAVVASLALTGTDALGHDRRTVGAYQLVVGFLTEPAYAGQPNGLDLRVTDTRSNQPVEGLEKTLKADVRVGGLAPLPLTLAARFGQAGAYAAQFVPTKAGTYIFHVTGKIGAQDVDELFESGPNRFNDVEGLPYPLWQACPVVWMPDVISLHVGAVGRCRLGIGQQPTQNPLLPTGNATRWSNVSSG